MLQLYSLTASLSQHKHCGRPHTAEVWSWGCTFSQSLWDPVSDIKSSLEPRASWLRAAHPPGACADELQDVGVAAVVQDGHLPLEAAQGGLLHLAVLAHLDGHRLPPEHPAVHCSKSATAQWAPSACRLTRHQRHCSADASLGVEAWLCAQYQGMLQQMLGSACQVPQHDAQPALSDDG